MLLESWNAVEYGAYTLFLVALDLALYSRIEVLQRIKCIENGEDDIKWRSRKGNINPSRSTKVVMVKLIASILALAFSATLALAAPSRTVLEPQVTVPAPAGFNV